MAGEFTRTLGAMGRRVERTERFELHMLASSFAAQHAADIGARLDALAAALGEILALPSAGLARQRARVYLGETLPDPQNPGGTITSGSRVIRERLEVWSVYRPDAPGLDLGLSIVRLLLLQSMGQDVAARPVLWAGIAGLCDRRIDRAPASQDVEQTLAQTNGGRPQSLNALWGSQQSDDPTAQLVALSFLGFLLRRSGAEALHNFVATVLQARPEEAARLAYRTPLAKLQKAWWEQVRRAGHSNTGDIGRFLRSSLHYLRPYWKQEIAILILLGVRLAFLQIFPRAQALLIDKAILPRDLDWLFGIALFLFVMVILVLIAGVLNDLLTVRVSESVLRTLRERMFRQLQRASHRFYNRMESGDIISRFGNDLSSVEQGLTNTLTQGIFLTLSLALSAVHILLINVPLAALVFASLPLFFLSSRFLGPRASRASLAFSQEQAAITGLLQEDLAAQPVVKAYNLQGQMVERFRVQAGALYRAAVRLFFLSSLFGVTANLLTTAVQVGVLTLGSYFVIQGQLQLGSLIEFLALLGLVIGPVQSASGLLQSMQIATASMARVEEILTLEPDIQDAADAVELGPLQQGIRFEHVSFSYRGDQWNLDDVSFEIPAGTTVAFVGPSGSGKSTIVNLLMRFYDPDRGRIVFDGHDLKQITLHSLRRQVGVVFQESFLFNATIRENLRQGGENATDGETEAAAKQAQVHDAILQMPDGYETVVGERGSSLSGGQRQRLAIARAILRRPSALLLDEATSALDPRTENALNRTLAALAKGRTTVWVTHRLAAASGADRIFVLDEGHLVEEGRHDELLEAGGLYSRLYEEQGGRLQGTQRALEVSYLRHVPQFAALAEDDLGRIAAFLRSEQARAGDAVVDAGTEGDKLYLIVSGDVEVSTQPAASQEPALVSLGPGDYFGEIALLYDIPRTATVRARTTAQFLTLDKATFQGLCEAIPDLRTKLEAAVLQRAQAVRSSDSSGDTDGDRTEAVASIAIWIGPNPGRRFSLTGVRTRLGRDSANEIVLSDVTVSGSHACISLRPDGLYEIVDSGSTNGTLINGRRIDGSSSLRDGDTIGIGNVSLIFHEPAGT